MANLVQEGQLNLQLKLEEYTDEFGDVHDRIIPILVRTPVKKHQKLHKYDTLRYTYADPQLGKQVISIPKINYQWQQEQYRKQKEKQLKEVQKLLATDSIKNTPRTKTTVMAMVAVIRFKISVFFCGNASLIKPGSLITSLLNIGVW